MARVKKNLKNQLEVAKKKLLKAEADVKNYKNKISKIENMIEEQEKEDIYSMIKEHGLSSSDLQKLLIQSKTSLQIKDNKKIKNENVA